MMPSALKNANLSIDAQGETSEMARLIAGFDWSSTPLGARQSWPSSLCCVVRVVLASPSPLVVLWGREGTMLYNDAYAVFAGSRHPFLLGKPVELGWPEVAAFNRHVVDTCLAGGALSYKDKELVLYREGHPEAVWMDLSYSPVPSEGGQSAGVIAIVFETTAKVRAERQRQEAENALVRLTGSLEERVATEVSARVAVEERLRQAHKLEALGSLTGGIAHDFNNVLQVISANLQLADLAADAHETLRRRLAIACDAVEKGAKLASQVLAFARRQPLAPMVLKPGRIVDAMAEMLRRTLAEVINLVIAADRSTWNICADRNQLEAALLNLVVNARDAISTSGTIRICVEDIDSATDTRAAADAIPAGEHVRISVTDTGSGMSEHVKAHAMEPFFTTKELGHGTGLGLSTVFGFVSQSDGHVRLQSEERQGTRVDLYFPRTFEPEHEYLRMPADQPKLGGETILVVEDDIDVRTAAIDMLSELGYEVLSAPNGDAALALLESGQRIDLLFTDVVMPGAVSSRRLAEIARRPPLDLPVLFASGYPRAGSFHGSELDEGVTLISKPYRLDELARAVRNALARAGDTSG